MDQCKGLTKNGFRCRLKTKYGYCRFHREPKEIPENNDKVRIVNKIKCYITINQRTKQIRISRDFILDKFMEEEKSRREELKKRIINELGYGLHKLELKEVIEKNLPKCWTKKQVIKIIREQLTNERIKMEEYSKNKIDYYFVKIDKIRNKEKTL